MLTRKQQWRRTRTRKNAWSDLPPDLLDSMMPGGGGINKSASWDHSFALALRVKAERAQAEARRLQADKARAAAASARHIPRSVSCSSLSAKRTLFPRNSSRLSFAGQLGVSVKGRGKYVSFDTQVKMILIPRREEYSPSERILMWWGRDDYGRFRQVLIEWKRRNADKLHEGDNILSINLSTIDDDDDNDNEGLLQQQKHQLTAEVSSPSVSVLGLRKQTVDMPVADTPPIAAAPPPPPPTPSPATLPSLASAAEEEEEETRKGRIEGDRGEGQMVRGSLGGQGDRQVQDDLGRLSASGEDAPNKELAGKEELVKTASMGGVEEGRSEGVRGSGDGNGKGEEGEDSMASDKGERPRRAASESSLSLPSRRRASTSSASTMSRADEKMATMEELRAWHRSRSDSFKKRGSFQPLVDHGRSISLQIGNGNLQPHDVVSVHPRALLEGEGERELRKDDTCAGGLHTRGEKGVCGDRARDSPSLKLLGDEGRGKEGNAMRPWEGIGEGFRLQAEQVLERGEDLPRIGWCLGTQQLGLNDICDEKDRPPVEIQAISKLSIRSRDSVENLRELQAQRLLSLSA
ncbi:unnamed protein product [Choristocarpus tenellus]